MSIFNLFSKIFGSNDKKKDKDDNKNKKDNKKDNNKPSVKETSKPVVTKPSTKPIITKVMEATMPNSVKINSKDPIKASNVTNLTTYFTVTRNNILTPCTVNWVITGMNASNYINGQEFSGVLNFAGSTLSMDVPVTIVPQLLDSADKYIVFTITASCSIEGNNTSIITVDMPQTPKPIVSKRRFQPFHMPLVESDIVVWQVGTPIPKGNWTKYLLVVFPKSAYTKTVNINQARWKGVFVIGGYLTPVGDIKKSIKGTQSPLFSGLSGNLFRCTFADDMPSTLKGGNNRPFCWIDGLDIDSCGSPGDIPGTQQSVWFFDCFSMGTETITNGNFDTWSDTFYLRNRIKNGGYFFTAEDGTSQGDFVTHADIQQNESGGSRSTNVWKFEAKWTGQGWFIVGNGNFVTHPEGYFEISYANIKPMPGNGKFFRGTSNAHRPICSSDNSINSTTKDVISYQQPGNKKVVSKAASYYAVHIGEEVYLENKSPGTAGEYMPIIGRGDGSTVNLTRSDDRITFTADTRCCDAKLHLYPYFGSTKGGLFNRPDGAFKNVVMTTAPLVPVVSDTEVGISRIIDTPAGLISYLVSQV